MKLLHITCIKEYEKDVKKILKHSGVKAYSYHAVKGLKNDNGDKSWFVSESLPTDSLMFSVFIENACLIDIFKRVEEFNQTSPSLSKIHIACLQVEQSNF